MQKRFFFAIAFLAIALAGCGGVPKGDPARGEALYKQATLGAANAPGCPACHSLEPGEIIVGPSHAGVATRAAQVVGTANYSGEASTAEGYLRESIVDPDAYVEAGFAPGVMYQKYGEQLSERDIDDLVAFLMTRK